MKSSKNTRKGFTLIELLAVIAIIGVLAGLVSQAIPAAFGAVRRMSASNNLRQIATAIVSYNQGGGASGRVIKDGSEPKSGKASSVAEFAEVLARSQGLTDAAVWYIESDDALEDVTEFPRTVLSETTDGSNEMQNVKPASWAVVVNAKRSPKDSTRYPIAWLRGLETSGEWKDDAPFGSSHGIMAFADGHIESPENLLQDETKLRSSDGKNDTSSYQEAIGDNATVLEDTTN
ncbi:MAG: type II secretion system GspH family protein [Opitutae bacterium]|nr:type II secretion system GspH family protein [Opitutae bacterium]MCD8299531.1 type II secretion system GspH family protein [Opitutae bacterium]